MFLESSNSSRYIQNLFKEEPCLDWVNEKNQNLNNKGDCVFMWMGVYVVCVFMCMCVYAFFIDGHTVESTELKFGMENPIYPGEPHRGGYGKHFVQVPLPTQKAGLRYIAQTTPN